MVLDSVFTAVLVAVATVLVVLLLERFTKGTMKKRLPGPISLPLVGCLLSLDMKQPHLVLQRWAKKYGPVFVMRLGSVDCVVVSGYYELREMLVTNGKAFAGRYPLLRDRLLSYECKDVASGSPTQGHWAPMRKALYRSLRLLGDGQEQTDALLDLACHELVTEICARNGAAFDLHSTLYKFTMKSLFILLCGSVPQDNDSLFQQTMEFEKCVMPAIGQKSGFELDLFPWLRHLGHPAWKRLLAAVKRRKDIFEALWESSQLTYSASQNPLCLLHAAAQLVDPQATDQYVPGLDRDHLCGLVTDVLVAGTRTTVSSFYSLPNVLLHHPAVYTLLQQEVDAVVGRDRRPAASDRERMPYTQAVLLEFMRYHSVVATFPHSTLEEVSLGGSECAIGAGTLVLPLFWALHHDETFWDDPYVFRPERFLRDPEPGDTGAVLLPSDHPRRKHLMPFGAGSRVCVGELFAFRRLFIYIAFLAQSFDLHPDDRASELVSCDPRTYTAGVVLVSPPYCVRMIARTVE